MDLLNKVITKLFPTGPAWEGKEQGNLSKLIAGLSEQSTRDKELAADITRNYLPFETTFLTEQESLFRLPENTTLDEDERLKRIQGAWSGISPSDYDGFNELLALNGFDYVRVRPLENNEDPTTITDYYKIFLNGSLGVIINGYKTVTGNAILGAESGSSNLGYYEGSEEYPERPIIPTDERQWGMIFIIEGIDGGIAEIPDNQKSSFEFLIYKHKPLFMMGIARAEILPPDELVTLAIDDNETAAIDDDGTEVLVQGTQGNM